ncbi:MAG: hypothetical protein JXR48_14010 [Candidatus Delongbacteria bacterium]|nr:hypothetical protein [Candidatus Delongbacteria bacterium]MBN2836070.1 hypothetical protein [Candidatus Delongbacteria bacterium]
MKFWTISIIIATILSSVFFYNFHIVYGGDEVLTLVRKRYSGFEGTFLSMRELVKNIFSNDTDLRIRDNYIITKLSEKGAFKSGYKYIAEDFAEKIKQEILNQKAINPKYQPILYDLGIGRPINLDPKTYGVLVLRVEEGVIIVESKGQRVKIKY